MDNLASKESAIQNVSTVYRTGTLDSIGQIQGRFFAERDVLLRKCDDDRHQFGHTVRVARDAIHSSSQKRRMAVEELEETLARRRLLYGNASTSLQGLHRELLGAHSHED